MEFIPIKKKPKGKNTKQTVKSPQNEVKIKENKKIKKPVIKPMTQKEELKKIKLKAKKKIKKKLINKKKKNAKGKKTEEDEEMVQDEDEDRIDSETKDDDIDEDEEREDEDDEDDDGNENDSDDDLTKQKKAFAKKCQQMNEKMKTRLFIKLQRKIKSEATIKELHPDIKGVIFPRKKHSRWCWAVFTSEQKADQALKKLSKRTDILVNKPNRYDEVHQKQEKKIKTIIRKKEARKKFVQMWM